MIKKTVLLVIVSMCTAGVAFAGSPFGSNPMNEALDAMDGGTGYVVNAHWVWQWANDFHTFEPDNTTPTKGIIIYPGANVDVRSYAVLAAELAQNGYLVALVPMPLDLALLGYNRANKVIDKIDDIGTWAISGHSLGGVMACNYAESNQNKVDGVILLASYPSDSYRLDGTSLAVLSIYGTNDGLTTLAEIQASVAHLPADAEFYEIVGGNHSQFGYYTPDTSGDNAATITRAEQTDEIATAIIDFMPGL